MFKEVELSNSFLSADFRHLNSEFVNLYENISYSKQFYL